MSDSFATRDHLSVNGRTYTYFSLAKLGQRFDLARQLVVLRGEMVVDRHHAAVVGVEVGSHRVDARPAADDVAHAVELADAPVAGSRQRDVSGMSAGRDLLQQRHTEQRRASSHVRRQPLSHSFRNLGGRRRGEAVAAGQLSRGAADGSSRPYGRDASAAAS